MPTIESILASDHREFELIVVDQSPTDDTADAMRSFRADPRVHYIRSADVGKGHALTTALAAASAPIIAITDDDVTVPGNWLTVMENSFEHRPEVALVFCNVVAASHDSRAGFVPDYVRSGIVEITTMREKRRARGIGAGLAVRRDAVVAMGGFDLMLGPGAPLGSTDDRDLALRAIMSGRHVLETDAVAVVHHGFRTWEEGRALTRRDWFGMGTSCAKPIRVGRWDALVVVLWEGICIAVLKSAFDTLRRRRLSGLRQGWYFWRGFVTGWRHPLDRQTMCFIPDRP